MSTATTPGHGQGVVDVHGAERGVGDLGAGEHGVQLAGQVEVVEVPRRTGEQRGVLGAQHPGPQDRARRIRRGNLSRSAAIVAPIRSARSTSEPNGAAAHGGHGVGRAVERRRAATSLRP